MVFLDGSIAVNAAGREGLESLDICTLRQGFSKVGDDVGTTSQEQKFGVPNDTSACKEPTTLSTAKLPQCASAERRPCFEDLLYL
jgi:hypothetical protein